MDTRLILLRINFLHHLARNAFRSFHHSVSVTARHTESPKQVSPFSRAIRSTTKARRSNPGTPLSKKRARRSTFHSAKKVAPNSKNLPLCASVWNTKKSKLTTISNIQPSHQPKLQFVASCSKDHVLPWSQITTKMISDAITNAFGFTHCNTVQSVLYKYLVPRGVDAMIRSPTGSGKTLTFLVPAFRHLITESDNAKPIKGPRVLIICPTRELATQTKRTAQLLASHCFNRVRVGSIIPELSRGNKRASELSCLHNFSSQSVPNLLVATPGRLLEILGQSPEIVADIDMLILDEADRMLDSNFADQVGTILDFLPTDRQTLLFSATFSESIRTLAHSILKPNYVAVTTVKDLNAPTVDTVRQFYTIASMAKQPILVHTILYRAWMAQSKYSRTTTNPLKCIIFLPTVKMTKLYSALFRHLFSNQVEPNSRDSSSESNQLPEIPSIIELHSDMSKMDRTRASYAFQQPKPAILITTDVSARGVDYPNVALVLQVGMPINTDTYIHRLGRTARAGEQGVGILILSGSEQGAAIQMLTSDGVPIIEASLDNGCVMELGNRLGDSIKWCGSTSLRMVQRAVRGQAVGQDMVSDAYLGQIGYYENLMPRLLQYQTSGYTLIKELDALVSLLGLKELPNLPQALRLEFLKPHKATETHKFIQLGKAAQKCTNMVSKRSKLAAQNQHKHNQRKILGISILKSKKPMLDNQFLYRP